MTIRTLRASSISPAAEGTRPLRVVLRKDATDKCTPYRVHTETDPGTPSRAYHCGGYHETLEAASMEYVTRCVAARVIPTCHDFRAE